MGFNSNVDLCVFFQILILTLLFSLIALITKIPYVRILDAFSELYSILRGLRPRKKLETLYAGNSFQICRDFLVFKTFHQTIKL